MKRKILIFLFNVYYQLHLAYCFFFRPTYQGAYVLCIFGDEFFAIKNSYKSHWTLPCGMIDKGETPAVAARRELFEEVGISVEESELSSDGVILNTSEFKKDYINLFTVKFDERPIVKLDNLEVIDSEWRKISDPGENMFLPIKKHLASLK